MMKSIFAFFIILTATTALMAQEEVGENNEFRGLAAVTSDKRQYPGGRDDSDLMVQPARKLVKKGEEVEPDHMEGEGPEYNASGSDEGFGANQ